MAMFHHMQRKAHSATDYSSLLQQTEVLLWSEPRQYLIDDTVGLLLISCSVLIIVVGVLWGAFLYKGSMGTGNEELLLFMLALSLSGFLLAGLRTLLNRKQVYILTDKRAIIAVRCLRRLHVVQVFPLSSHMIKGINRYGRNYSDYAFAYQYMGKTTQVPVGFIGVKHAAELEAKLSLCGVDIPS